jgi:hypothetical protein
MSDQEDIIGRTATRSLVRLLGLTCSECRYFKASQADRNRATCYHGRSAVWRALETTTACDLFEQKK